MNHHSPIKETKHKEKPGTNHEPIDILHPVHCPYTTKNLAGRSRSPEVYEGSTELAVDTKKPYDMGDPETPDEHNCKSIREEPAETPDSKHS